MRTPLRSLITLLVLALGPISARAELSASLMEELASPVIRIALSTSPEGRALAERMIGDRILLTPARPEAWRAQTERMVQGVLERQAPGTADDVYLRLLRLKSRFKAQAPEGSLLAQGTASTEVSPEELNLALNLASDEFALRAPTFFERMQGVASDLGGKLEFAQPQEGKGSFTGARQRFLLSNGSQGGSAYDRSLATLRKLVEGNEAPFMLVRTPEGGKIMDLVYGPGPRVFNGVDPAKDFVEKLAADPGRRDLVIQLAFRLNRAMESYDFLKAKMGFGERGAVRRAVLERIAREQLALAAASEPKAIRFTP